MLEKPDLQDDRIIDALRDTYGLRVAELAFLPLGADVNTAVYRVVGEDGTAYFVKLRSGIFNEITVLITRFLNEQGIEQIIPPLATTTGELWISVEDFKMVLYPFVEGHNGYEVELSDQHWRDLGKALKRVHTAQVPPELRVGIPNESYSPEWRDSVKRFLVDDDRALTDTVAVELAAFLQEKRAEILDLVGRAERLAQELQSQLETLVLCHADIHAGNGLIDKTGTLYLVDWDTLIFAPKERDLMFVGGGLWGDRRTAQEEERLFYEGYGEAQIDAVALAYFRYERIVQDIAAFCEEIFLTTTGEEDRVQALRYLKANFLPDSTIELAYKSDKMWNMEHGI